MFNSWFHITMLKLAKNVIWLFCLPFIALFAVLTDVVKDAKK